MSSVISTAQEVDPNWQAALEELFENPEGIDWMGAYKGIKGAYFPFVIYLAAEGEHVKGWYQYDDDNRKYGLDGVLQGDILVMEEHYNNTIESGIFKGSFDREVFAGEWSNYSGSLTWDVYFQPDYFPKPLEDASLVPVFITFTTKEPGLTGKWHLFTDYRQTMHGLFVSKDKSVHQVRVLKIPEVFNTSKEYYLYLLGEKIQPGIRFKLDLTARKGEILEFKESTFNLNEFKIWHKATQKKSSGFHQFILQNSLPEMDRRTARVVIFNDTACMNPSRIPFRKDHRGDVLRTSVFYPTFISKRFISGLYSVNHITDDSYCQAEFSFLWDTRKKEWLDPYSEVKDMQEWNRQLDTFKRDYLNKMLRDKPVGSPWHDLKPDDFMYPVLSDAGLLLARGYDTVFGVLFIPVPQDILTGHFDKKSMVIKALQSKL